MLLCVLLCIVWGPQSIDDRFAPPAPQAHSAVGSTNTIIYTLRWDVKYLIDLYMALYNFGELASITVGQLRALVPKHNLHVALKGYSKMKKTPLPIPSSGGVRRVRIPPLPHTHTPGFTRFGGHQNVIKRLS